MTQELERIATGQHKARYLTINGHRVRIDKNIAPLIRGLNELGIQTISSCGADCGGVCHRKHRIVDGNHLRPKACQESIWILFKRMRDAAKFMNVVYRASDSEELRDQMQGYRYSDLYSWIWHSDIVDVNDQRYIDNRGYWVGKSLSLPKFDFQCHLVLPHAHVELVTQRVLMACGETEL